MILFTVLLAATQSVPTEADLRSVSNRFAPAMMSTTLSALPPSERTTLDHLVRAAKFLDAVYLRQLWAGNTAALMALARDRGDRGLLRLDAFLFNKGPWLRFDGDRPLLPDLPANARGTGFYPADSTRAEIEGWQAKLSAVERKEAVSLYTVVRRRPDRSLMTVPDSLEYQEELTLAGAELLRAADATHDEKLQTFLRARAAAFTSNDYTASDVLWLDLESDLSVLVGPYGVGDDVWFNAKAAFGATLSIVDRDATARAARLVSLFPEVEAVLPFAKGVPRAMLTHHRPLIISNVVFATGAWRAGATFLGSSMPDDEALVAAHGERAELFENVASAFFSIIVQPNAEQLLRADQARQLDVAASLDFSVAISLSETLLPVNVANRAVTVREALKDHYIEIEELAAEAATFFVLEFAIAHGAVSISRESLDAFYFARLLALTRQGMGNRGGSTMTLAVAQLNHFLDAKALLIEKDHLVIDHGRTSKALAKLLALLLDIRARGDHKAAADWVARAQLRPELENVLDRVSDLPVEIESVYPDFD